MRLKGIRRSVHGISVVPAELLPACRMRSSASVYGGCLYTSHIRPSSFNLTGESCQMGTRTGIEPPSSSVKVVFVSWRK